MGFSKIQITFLVDLEVDNAVGFTISSPVPNFILNFASFRWVNVRSGASQVSIGTPTGTPGERSAINFIQAFELDYNATLNYKVTRSVNVVTIESKISTVEFSSAFYKDVYFESTGTLGRVEFSITNSTSPAFSLVNLSFSEATSNDPCTHYKVSVETSVAADSVIGSHTIPSGNTQNPFTFERLRGQGFSITMFSADGQQLSQSRFASQVPSLLNSGLVSLVITNSPNGATVVVNSNNVNNLTLEYSLDNTNWISENEFSGLAAGSYILYVRDNFGCSFNISFTIDESGVVRLPYFKWPKSNPFRMSERVDWGNCSDYKTDDNTFCHETEDVEEPKGYVQDWQTCDIVPAQFQTSYAVQSVKIIKSDDSEIVIPVNKQSNYIGLKDSRDARKYDLGSGKTGIYFTSGNIYNYDTGVDTNEDYTLNGYLPDWATVGNFIKVDSSWYLIEQIITDINKNAQVIVISNNYSGSDVAVIVSALYNLEDFEEYEFSIDMSTLNNECFQIQLICTDPDFETITYLSEYQHVETVKPGTVEIIYRNSTNTDVNFSRGITFKLRMFVERVSARDDEETQTNKTDRSAYLSESQINDVDEFLFSPVPKQFMRLLKLALSHDTVTIKGVNYIKNENIKIDGPLEATNLYDVTAVMIRTEDSFNSNLVKGTNEVNSQDIVIPGLIESDSGYIGY